MDPEQRDAYQTLLKELENVGEEADSTKQILQLAQEAAREQQAKQQKDKQDYDTEKQFYDGLSDRVGAARKYSARCCGEGLTVLLSGPARLGSG